LTLDRGQFIKVLGNDIQALVQKGMDKKCLVSICGVVWVWALCLYERVPFLNYSLNKLL